MRYGKTGAAGTAWPGRYLRTTPCITLQPTPRTVFELHGSNFTFMFLNILSGYFFNILTFKFFQIAIFWMFQYVYINFQFKIDTGKISENPK